MIPSSPSSILYANARDYPKHAELAQKFPLNLTNLILLFACFEDSLASLEVFPKGKFRILQISDVGGIETKRIGISINFSPMSAEAL